MIHTYIHTYIHAQAAIAHLLLRHKVQKWAGSCNGMFPVAEVGNDSVSTSLEEQQLVKWSDICHDPHAESKVKWPTLKSRRVS